MLAKFRGTLAISIGVIAFLLIQTFSAAASDKPAEPATETTEPAPANLAATQEVIEMRYRRFEGTLQQLSEYLRKTDPARAELLVRAIGKSKEGRIPEQMKHLTDLLKKDQLGDAVERQELVVTELQSLLELLMSEARKDDLEREKKRIQELIKDVNRLIGKETDARAQTERGGNNNDLQNQQKQVADSTQKLVQRIEAQDAAKKAGKNEKGAESKDKSGKSGDKDSSDKDSPDKKGSDQKDGDSEKSPSKDGQESPSKEKNDRQGKSGEKLDDANDKQGDKKSTDDKSSKPEKDQPGKEGEENPDSTEKGDSQKSPDGKSDDGKSQQGKSGQKKPQEGKSSKSQQKSQKSQDGQQQQDQQPQEGQESQDQQDQSQDQEGNQKKQPDKTAGREEIERAKQEMDRAIEELKKNSRKNASDKQDKAIAELMKAKEKLEEILRQLREEERELVLAQMEARFRDMLLKQEAVYNGTVAIHAVPADKRTDRHRNRAVELARNEEEISLLAAKALTLLKEEGSSVAFPEAVEQIREDMLTIARRLERADVEEITQNIEQDTIESLKEMIEAMQKELEKLKDKKQQQQQQQQQQQKEQQGLVNKLAEMKMLRSLQYRVNRRTKQLGRLVDGEQAVDPDVIGQLKQLSDRQAKVQKATYDLSTGKNQ